MSTRRQVIVNGKVAKEPEVETALELLTAGGEPCEIRITREPDDARRYARAAAEAGAEEIIVFGGDGTINEVVSGLAPPDADGTYDGTLGVIPTGTANDFATCSGIPAGSPSEAVKALAGYRPVKLDLGHLLLDPGDGSETTATFLNVATAGFGAEVSSDASEELKAVLGKVAYLVAGIAGAGEMEPREAAIEAPDFKQRLAFYLLAIGNARCAGGGMPVCPDADPTDGLFDVTIVPEGTVGKTAAEIIRTGLEGMGDAGLRFRAPWLEIRSERPLQINLDGEPASGTHFRFEVRPRVLRVLLPTDSPLLSRGGGCGRS